MAAQSVVPAALERGSARNCPAAVSVLYSMDAMAIAIGRAACVLLQHFMSQCQSSQSIQSIGYMTAVVLAIVGFVLLYRAYLNRV